MAFEFTEVEKSHSVEMTSSTSTALLTAVVITTAEFFGLLMPWATRVKLLAPASENIRQSTFAWALNWKTRFPSQSRDHGHGDGDGHSALTG